MPAEGHEHRPPGVGRWAVTGWLVVGSLIGGACVGLAFASVLNDRLVQPDEATAQNFFPTGVLAGAVVGLLMAIAVDRHGRAPEGERVQGGCVTSVLGLVAGALVAGVALGSYAAVWYQSPYNRSESAVADGMAFHDVVSVGEPARRIGGVDVSFVAAASFDPTNDVTVPSGFTLVANGGPDPFGGRAAFRGPDPYRQSQACTIDLEPVDHNSTREAPAERPYHAVVVCGLKS